MAPKNQVNSAKAIPIVHLESPAIRVSVFKRGSVAMGDLMQEKYVNLTGLGTAHQDRVAFLHASVRHLPPHQEFAGTRSLMHRKSNVTMAASAWGGVPMGAQ